MVIGGGGRVMGDGVVKGSRCKVANAREQGAKELAMAKRLGDLTRDEESHTMEEGLRGSCRFSHGLRLQVASLQ